MWLLLKVRTQLKKVNNNINNLLRKHDFSLIFPTKLWVWILIYMTKNKTVKHSEGYNRVTFNQSHLHYLKEKANIFTIYGLTTRQNINTHHCIDLHEFSRSSFFFFFLGGGGGVMYHLLVSSIWMVGWNALNRRKKNFLIPCLCY